MRRLVVVGPFTCQRCRMPVRLALGPGPLCTVLEQYGSSRHRCQP